MNYSVSSQDQLILEVLEDFKPLEDSPTRRARRPGTGHVLIEVQSLEGGRSAYRSLADFWVHSLYHFLEDTGTKREFFEGTAYQSQFRRLSPAQFWNDFSDLQNQLTLPPPGMVELREAFEVLTGRVKSYAGVTLEGDYWSGTFGPTYYDSLSGM